MVIPQKDTLQACGVREFLLPQRAQGIGKCVMYVDDGMCLLEGGVWTRVIRRYCKCVKYVDDRICLLKGSA